MKILDTRIKSVQNVGEMLVLGSDMLAKCSQMLAPLQQYADKVLPYANAALWLLYDVTAGPMQ